MRQETIPASEPSLIVVKKEVLSMPVAKCLVCSKNSFKYSYKGKCSSCGAGVMTKARAKSRQRMIRKKRR